MVVLKASVQQFISLILLCISYYSATHVCFSALDVTTLTQWTFLFRMCLHINYTNIKILSQDLDTS